MKLSHQVFSAFLVILILVILGLLINFHFLFQMLRAQDHMNTEWKELNRMVEMQSLITKISDEVTSLPRNMETGKSLSDDIRLLQDKVSQMAGNMLYDDEESESEDHRQDEDAYFGRFVYHIADFFKKLPDPTVSQQWSINLTADARDSLNRAEHAGYLLQQSDMKEMIEAAGVVEKLRKDLIRWSILIFVSLIVTIIVFSLWFVRIFRQKTDAFIRNEQLMTVSVMAQSLAHEIRNPLGIIKSSTSVLRKKLGQDADSRELLGYLAEEVDRIDDLLKQLMNLSETPAARQNENVRVIIETLCALMRPQSEKAGIRINYEDHAVDPMVVCHANQIKQLLINLILNAIHASEPGRDILIRTSEPGKGIYRLMVEDHGCGMDAKTLKRAFEPFFTTKTQGTGFGLVMVKKIVDWHQGRIKITSQPGQGTVIEIDFPKGDL